MLVPVCDRCTKIATLQPHAGRELCARCIASFQRWMATGKRVGARSRLTSKNPDRLLPGESARIAERLIAAHGYACPDDFAAITGQDRRHAYFALRHLAKVGVLEGGQQAGCGVRFRLREQRREAAE